LSQQRQQQVLVRFGTTQPEANPWGAGSKKHIGSFHGVVRSRGVGRVSRVPRVPVIVDRHGQKADEVPIF
jgi:hypothetical protein